MSDVNVLPEIANSYYMKMKGRTPTQWATWFEPFADGTFEWFYKGYGFNTLESFITSTVSKHGLGLTMEQFKFLLTYNKNYKHVWEPIVKQMKLEKTVETKTIATQGGDNTKVDLSFQGYIPKDVTLKTEPNLKRGNTFAYKIAKLKRDFGEEAVIAVVEEYGFTKATEIERHFGVGKPLLTPIERLIKAYDRLSDEDKIKFKGEIK